MIHLVTPVSRLENLSRIACSIATIKAPTTWWQIHDCRKVPQPTTVAEGSVRVFPGWPSGFGAGFLRQLAVEQIDSGWIFGLDDDTLVHPDLERAIAECDAREANLGFWQVLGRDDQVRNDPRTGAPADTASFAYRAEHWRDMVWRRNDWNCDVVIAREMRANPRAKIHRVEFPAGYYNRLRGDA